VRTKCCHSKEKKIKGLDVTTESNKERTIDVQAELTK
jgi:hypothetical protein